MNYGRAKGELNNRLSQNFLVM